MRFGFARATGPTLVGVIVLAGYAAREPEKGASAQPLELAGNGAATKEHVIAGRPAIYALPPGCGPAGKKFQCNPATNAGCDGTKGEACDDDDHGGFGCYEGPNAGKEGAECSDEEGCAGGLGCDTDDGEDDGVCRRYCCTNADCGAKTCVVIEKSFGSLGFCN